MFEEDEDANVVEHGYFAIETKQVTLADSTVHRSIQLANKTRE